MDFFDNLINRKKHDCAIILGCGKSISDLTEDNIAALKNFDVWASNSFMIHKSIAPDFYHLEVKAHRNGPLVSRLSKERAKLYAGTSWVLDQTREYIFNFFDRASYSPKNILLYPKKYRSEEHGSYFPHPSHVSVSANASMTVIADLAVRMKYDTIYVLGIDMDTSEYFWTDSAEYADVEIENIIKTTKPDERHPQSVHPTAHMVSYLPEFMRYNRQNFVNLSKRSLFKDVITTAEINDVIK